MRTVDPDFSKSITFRNRCFQQLTRCRILRIAQLAVFAVLAASCSLSNVEANEIIIHVDDEIGSTGRYLTGIHFVYSDEKDDIYEDDSIARWARKAGIPTARFPGGTVIKYWDWKDPTGYQKVDIWDDPESLKAAPSEWMSLNEYLHFAEVSGITPLIGINMLSGVRNDRVDESIERAREQVQYVVSKGFEGVFYYLGNEEISQVGNIEKEARIFVRHARAIESVDPTARLLWNDNAVNDARLRRFLAIAGSYADGVEFHGKWPYGGRQNKRLVTLQDWQKHYPFSVLNRGRFSQRALELRAYAEELGYPDLMFANNEYGLSQFEHERFVDFDRFDYSLVALEFLQDLFIGQFDMAAYWSNVPSGGRLGGERSERSLIDTESGNRLNPLHFGFEMLSSALGKRLVRMDSGSHVAYGFATLEDGQLEVFLLNKTNENEPIELNIRGSARPRSTAIITSLVDTPDHWGTLHKSNVTVSAPAVPVVLPAMSYSKITLPLE